MTIHSTHKRVTHREQFDKAVHAKAHKDNVRFQQALGEYIVPHNTQARTHHAGHTSRPVPDYSLRQFQLLEDTTEPEFEDIYDFMADFGSSPITNTVPHAGMTVSLLDLARPERGKGKITA
ncbi:hypothetical protein D9619_006281 [Psilocybe cf. subviscida]|uniref:Uncharacterized protein n=1 Tax=Psilocybe cf. subviscida TaxID=2480587 RepID=A0A8H5B4E8_9AGAR|nr:hypothetical protein D9619_006281 [Psilocybe cf. subviscida]